MAGKFTLSLDNTYLSQITAEPYLTTRKIKPTLFIQTANVGTGNFMSIAQIQNLMNLGWTIGNHTVNHYDLSGQTFATIESEISTAKTWIIDNLGVTPKGLAYPGGGTITPDMQQLSRKYHDYAIMAVGIFWLYPYKETILYSTTSGVTRGRFYISRQTYSSVAVAKTDIDTAALKNYLWLPFAHDFAVYSQDTLNLDSWLEILDYALTKLEYVNFDDFFDMPGRLNVSGNMVRDSSWADISGNWTTALAGGSTYSVTDGVLSLARGTSNCSLTQNVIPVQPGKSYTYSYDIRRTAGTGNSGWLLIRHEGQITNYIVAATSTSATWETKTGAFIPQVDCIYIIVAESSNNTTHEFRNFSISPTTASRTVTASRSANSEARTAASR